MAALPNSSVCYNTRTRNARTLSASRILTDAFSAFYQLSLLLLPTEHRKRAALSIPLGKKEEEEDKRRMTVEEDLVCYLLPFKLHGLT